MLPKMQRIWFFLGSAFMFLLLTSLAHAISSEKTTTANSTVTVTAEETDDEISNRLPTAAKLVRLRRHPPITIIKHVIRSSKHSKPRRRIKRPKIRYGPPSYVYEDQASYYKPHYAPSLPSESPAFSMDEHASLNLNAADFDLPPSSYEAQSMELDFYSNAEEDTSYKSIPKIHTFSPEYSGLEFEPSIEPTYSYKHFPRKPHQKYGVPKNLEYSSDFNVNSNSFSTPDYSLYNAYQSQSGQSQEGSSIHYGNSNTDAHPVSTPLDQYNPQTHSFPTTHQSAYNVKSSIPDEYAIYDTKLPNSGYDHRDSEHQPSPTQSHPAQPASEIEITYSPSYEINLLPTSKTNEKPYESSDPNYQPGNFAEPPEQHPPTSNYGPRPDLQPVPGPVDYISPSEELPLNPHHKQPAYDYPKSSYEVPIYDPIPFEASTNDDQEFYPPHGNEPPQTTKVSKPQQENFETQFQAEKHQPNEYLTTPASEGQPRDTHTSESDVSTTSTTKIRQNRKRKRRPLTSSTRHILDVPELKEAFEAARPTKKKVYSSTNTDPDVNASTFVEEKHKTPIKKPNKSPNNLVSQEWNPMRIRTGYTTLRDESTSKDSLRTRTTAISVPKIPGSKKMQPQLRSGPQPLPTDAIPVPEKKQTTSKTALVSIEKSQSQSYYDGTLAPPILTISNIYNSRLNKFKTPTRPPIPKLPSASSSLLNIQRTSKDTTTVKHTTRSIFDTTHFKVPQNDWGGTKYKSRPSLVGLNLPKNHKIH